MMKYRSVRSFVLCCFTLLAGSYAAGADDPGKALTAEQLVNRYRQSMSAIKTVEARYAVYVDVEKANGERRNAAGHQLMYQHNWGWERESNREYAEGIYGIANVIDDEKEIEYLPNHLVFNGYEMLTKGAFAGTQIIGKNDNPQQIFRTVRGPLELIGNRLAFVPDRDLSDLLSGDVEATRLNKNEYLLKTEFREGQPGAGEMYTLLVWLDADHGYLPRAIKTMRQSVNEAIWKEVNATRFVKTEGGTWFPTAGDTTFYYTSPDFELPDGLTEEQVVKMSDAEKAVVRSRTKFKSVPLGMGTYYYEVDPESVRLNHEIEDDRFDIKDLFSGTLP